MITEDSVFRQFGRRFLISLSIIFCLFAAFQWFQLRQLYTHQSLQYQKIVGTVVQVDPSLETAVVGALFEERIEDYQVGEQVLAKYGYDANTLVKDQIFNPHLQRMMKLSLIGFAGFGLITLGVGFFWIYRLVKELFALDQLILKMSDGTCISVDEINEEGIIGRLYADLNKLSRSLRMKIAHLNQDRESLKELVTDISHQFKTPLASLELYQSLLREEELSEEERLEFLQTNDQSILKLGCLIDSLINISRLEAGMMWLQPKQTSLNLTLNQAMKSVKAKGHQKNIELSYENSNDYQLVYDRKWTEEAIINVLDNAIKYTPEFGQVKISVHENLNFIEIRVIDNGMGIHPSEYSRIFKRFYRIKGVESIEGSGVGLYLSRKILESQGGSIMVSSKLNQGSTFSIFLTKL